LKILQNLSYNLIPKILKKSRLNTR
jgi:hypothetical protein